MLWLLIQNGTLQSGSVLFWDEPEANLNPKMFKTVMSVLLELQRAGVQVFFATHDYVILKELDLQMTEEDNVAFHSLYRDDDGEIACSTTHTIWTFTPMRFTKHLPNCMTARSNAVLEADYGDDSRRRQFANHIQDAISARRFDDADNHRLSIV